jgi:Ca2+-binding EF-hand superfamily protein
MVSGISGFGSFSSASLSEMRQKMFNQIDTNGDGSINKNEFSAMAGQNSSSLVDEIFGKTDANNDSLISKSEFDSAMAKLEQKMKSSHSGAQAMSGMPSPDKVFDTADTNGDGNVTQDELTAVMGDKAADVFSKVDTNGDGKISRAEDEAFRAKMDEQMQQNDPQNFGANTIGSSAQDWQSKLFEALANVLTSSTNKPSDSTSLYA